MDEVIDIREDAAHGVAIRRQRRRFPFEIFNTLFTVICLASAVLVVYKLFQTQPREVGMGSFMFVIHAKADVTSGGQVKLNSKDNAWVKNNTIEVPCDGLYLIYARFSMQSVENPKRIENKVKIAKMGNHGEMWPLAEAEVDSPLLVTYELRSKDRIHMSLDQSGQIHPQDTYLGITLLQVQQEVEACQENIQRKR